MPLPERVIQPVAVCRGTLQLPVPDELEGVTNGSLANITRQLSTLSRHAEEMFGNLFMEAEQLAGRGSSLQARIDKLAVKVTQLDSNVEEVTLQEIQLRKAFRSTQSFDQQVVARETMPKSMLEQYLSCDKPPPLDKLNPYREDGKDGLKFYTDAAYFFDLWKSEMLQSTERAEKGRKGGLKSRPEGNRRGKRPRQPHNTTERIRQKVLQDGEYIMDDRLYAEGGGRTYTDSGPGGREGGGRGLSVSFNLPDSNGYAGGVPGGYEPSDFDRSSMRPNSIDLQQQGQAGPYSGYDRGNQGNQQPLPPTQRVVRFEDTSRNYTQEPIYTPRILREPDQRSVQFDLPPKQYMAEQQQKQHHHNHQQHMQQQQQQMLLLQQQHLHQQNQPSAVPDSPSDSSRSGTPQRRPTNPPPAPPPTMAAAVRNNSSSSVAPDAVAAAAAAVAANRASSMNGSNNNTGRDSLPPPPPPPAAEMAAITLNGPTTTPVVNISDGGDAGSVGATGADPDLPPPPPVPAAPGAGLNDDSSSLLGPRPPPAGHTAPSPPPPPAPGTEPPPPTGAAAIAVAPPPPPPPPPPPMENGIKLNGDIKKNQAGGMESVLKSIVSGQTQLKKASPIQRKPEDDVRSDLLKAIRDGISLKKVEQKADQTQSAGLSDVASILARRVALEVSDSDEDGPSDSEYDSDDWGETDA